MDEGGLLASFRESTTGNEKKVLLQTPLCAQKEDSLRQCTAEVLDIIKGRTEGAHCGPSQT
eukprot:1161381-Pelagomonas_calceolata.AAC.2